MRTKKKNISGGSYNDKVRVMRSCTKYRSIPSSVSVSNCKCVKTGDSFKYDPRFFECSETGLSLLDPSDVNPRFRALVNKIMEFDETYQKYNSRQEYIEAVDNYINKEYRVLGLSLDTKMFIREFILDDFKFRRRFKGEFGSKNVEILIKNLDKIKNRIKKRKNSENFTLKNLRTELKFIIKTLDNHISQVNNLIKQDRLEKEIQGDPYDFTGSKDDLDALLDQHKKGKVKLSQNNLAKRVNDAFRLIVKEITDVVYEFTESDSIKKAVISKLREEFGLSIESKKKFYFKYNNDPELITRFSVKFLKAIIDYKGAEYYKKFVDRKAMLKFVKLNVTYDPKFDKGAERGIDKYFEGQTLTEICNKIKSMKTLDNFLLKEYRLIESMAGKFKSSRTSKKSNLN